MNNHQSEIDQLIQELCPGGVKFKPLGDVCEIADNKRKPVKSSLRISGDVPYYGANNIQDYVEGFTHEGEYILIAEDGSASLKNYSIQYATEKFWANNHVHVVRGLDTLNNRFLFHYLRTMNFIPYLTGGTRAKLNKGKMTEIKIPVPPLEVQKEIVKILDKFTQLEAELEAELEARRKQYEFYRNKLLTFNDEGGVRWTTLGDVANKISSGGTPKTTVPSYYGGDIPWLRTQEVNFNEIWDTGVRISETGLKSSSAKIIPENCVIIAMYGATVGKSAINKISLSTNQACANIQVNPKVANYKYVFHWVNHNYKNIKALGTGSQTNINAQTVRSFKIPVPPPDEQERIVLILDKFDKLVNDISEGLPAELNARRKQYEYYRTKLLTFQEAKE